jgi:hypothetical protein
MYSTSAKTEQREMMRIHRNASHSPCHHCGSMSVDHVLIIYHLPDRIKLKKTIRGMQGKGDTANKQIPVEIPHHFRQLKSRPAARRLAGAK